MARDIDVIIERLRAKHPEVQVEQLRVTHPADDDGLWFFKSPHREVEVQLESSSGNCPFLIETDANANRINACTVDEALEILESWLDLAK